MCHSVILLAARKYMGARICVPQFLRELLLPASSTQSTLLDSMSLLKSPKKWESASFRIVWYKLILGGEPRLALAMPLCAQHFALAQLQLWCPWLWAQGLCLHWNLSFLFLIRCLWCSWPHLVVFVFWMICSRRRLVGSIPFEHDSAVASLVAFSAQASQYTHWKPSVGIAWRLSNPLHSKLLIL